MKIVAKTSPVARAFTLIEVVVALAIFTIGMIGVVGLFAPIAKSVTGNSEAEIAARVAGALALRLQAMPFSDVRALLKNATSKGHELTDADAKSDYDISKDAQLLFANRDGSKIGIYSDSIWIDAATGRNSDREKFFEIALIRNETLSPNDPAGDATTNVLAYTARIRWPAYVPDTGTTAVLVGSNPSGTVRFDYSRKQMLFVAGAVTR